MKQKFKKFLPFFVFWFYHFLIAFCAAIFYRFPSRQIKLIGITGTNGKTTTSEMIANVLEKAGFKIAILNSIRIKIGEKEEKNQLRMTMPGRFFIQRFLRKAVKEGCNFAILEVTSEGIKQHRHRFLKFKIAIFTNLSPEHIEAHGFFEKYREAKLELFKATKEVHIINCEDENSKYFLEIPAKKKITFGLKKGNINQENINLKIKLRGNFNLYNALAAFSVAAYLGINQKTAKEALENFSGVPGRMEEIISKPFKVIVDYAFTPNALEKVYQTLTSKLKPRTSNKLVCVLGACGGGRDKWKRPVLGEIAVRHCDNVIITNEDPYDEEPWQIIEQVAAGAKEKAKKILDRREAIREALRLAKDGDIVVITGKGCEPSIVEKGKKIPWDDRKVAREEFEKLFSQK